ncbi:uncharacterized protein [Misgurnus anguillicaudatus]|uniref:uncharacterized protein n=1 Tax=Misgurnus anguillicaudatus TaxID=75329 RepID=UPI003CCF536F
MADSLKMLMVILAIVLVREVDLGGTKRNNERMRRNGEEWSSQDRGMDQQNGNYQNTYEINMWYRYEKYVARSGNHTNCYVCSKMPKSGTNPHVEPEPILNTNDLFPECLTSAYTPVLLNATLKYRLPLPVDLNTLTFKNLPEDVSVRMYGPIHVSPRTKFICFENNLTLGVVNGYLGRVPEQNCHIMHTPCTTNHKGDFNESEARKGSTCTEYFTAPDAMGTNPQTNFVWLCGLTIYHYLSVGWTGRCALVRPTDHTATEVHRGKRDIFTKHDSIWGTDVPNDHKLWTNGQKVSLALFPWLGTGKLMLRMETFDYRFEQFVNSTQAALKGIREELTALRMMELQDRIVRLKNRRDPNAVNRKCFI